MTFLSQRLLNKINPRHKIYNLLKNEITKLQKKELWKKTIKYEYTFEKENVIFPSMNFRYCKIVYSNDKDCVVQLDEIKTPFGYIHEKDPINDRTYNYSDGRLLQSKSTKFNYN